jgi:hypothetical protein
MSKPLMNPDEILLDFFLTTNGSYVVFFIREQHQVIPRGNLDWSSKQINFSLHSSSTPEIDSIGIYLRGTNRKADYRAVIGDMGTVEDANSWVSSFLTALLEFKEFLTGTPIVGSYLSSMGYYQI